MRPIDIDWHIAGGHFVLEARAAWSKANQGNLVGSFGQNINEIVFVGFRLSESGSDCTEEGYKHQRKV